MKKSRRTARLLAMTASVLVGLAMAELALRATSCYRVLPTGTWTLRPDPAAIPGVDGEARYTTNAFGLRGTPWPEDGRMVALAIGGSTTECLYLDDDRTWPRLLERPGWWAGDAGKSGMTSAEHVLALQRFVPQLPRRPDVIYVLCGINDFRGALGAVSYRADMQAPLPTPERLDRAFCTRPADGLELQRVWTRFVKQRQIVDAYMREDPRGTVYVERRRAAGALPELDALPDLHEPLLRYRMNLEAIVAACAALGSELVLMTQPARWSDTTATDPLCWFAVGYPPRVRYSQRCLRHGLGLYNSVMRDVGRLRGVTVVDLDAVSERPENFYDDCHFTIAGAQHVAALVRATAPGG